MFHLIGLGTIINTAAILLGGVLGALFGRFLSDSAQDTLTKVCGVSTLFIALSGVVTGASWLCYYYAIQKGIVSVVVPIDKLSIIVSVVFSYFVFKERLSKKALLGLLLMVGGTLIMAIG